MATCVVPFVHAPSEFDVFLECPPDTATDVGAWYRFEVSFLNMFNEQVGLTHSARFRRGRAGSEVTLEITDAPTYRWPWGVLAEPV